MNLSELGSLRVELAALHAELGWASEQINELRESRARDRDVSIVTNHQLKLQSLVNALERQIRQLEKLPDTAQAASEQTTSPT